MKRDSQWLIELIRVARGEKSAELLLRNCRLVNVLTGKVEEADLAVSNASLWAGDPMRPGKSWISKEICLSRVH